MPALRGIAKALPCWPCGNLSSGLANVVLDWPMLAAVAHTGGAAALVIVLTGALVATQTHPANFGRAAPNLSRAIR